MCMSALAAYASNLPPHCFSKSHWDISSLWYWSMKLISFPQRCHSHPFLVSFNKMFSRVILPHSFYHCSDDMCLSTLECSPFCPSKSAEEQNCQPQLVNAFALESAEWEIYAFIMMSTEKFLFSVCIDLLLIHSIYYGQIIQLHVYIVVLLLVFFLLSSLLNKWPFTYYVYKTLFFIVRIHCLKQKKQKQKQKQKSPSTEPTTSVWLDRKTVNTY